MRIPRVLPPPGRKRRHLRVSTALTALFASLAAVVLPTTTAHASDTPTSR